MKAMVGAALGEKLCMKRR